MIKRTFHTPDQLPDWSGMFSQLVVVEKNGLKFIRISGQVGVDKTKQLTGDGSIEAQTRQSFKNVQIALEHAGATNHDVVKMNIYVVNYHYSHASIIKEEIEYYFADGQLPALSLIGVSALADERFLIEIEAEAICEVL